MHLERPLVVGHSSGAAVAAAVALAAPTVGGVMFLDGDGLPLNGTANGGQSTGGGPVVVVSAAVSHDAASARAALR